MASPNWYFYYQLSGEDVWIPALASDREAVVSGKKPRYTTVLDVDTNFDGEVSRDDTIKAHYRGSLYFDIDVSREMGGIEAAIRQTNKLVRNLETFGVNPRSLNIYASGSKGFHVLVPVDTFIAKEYKPGYQRLPVIYKEIAHRPDIYVDGIDPRVYSAQRGRMWRTENVQRENGKYKVPITYEELVDLTPEVYEEFVSGPRPRPTLMVPSYAPALATAFSLAQDSVEKRLKSMAKTKLDPVMVERWSRTPPKDLEALMAGRGIKDGAGFHPIAIQIALAATTFKWSTDEMVERCQGLIENHVGDGNRYDTPSKRRRELIRMYYYYEGGSGTYYEFALAPIKALLAPKAEVDVPSVDEGTDGDQHDDDEDDLDATLTAGVKVRKWGIFKDIDGVTVRASAIGFGKVEQLYDPKHNEIIGYVTELYLDGKLIGERFVTMNLFSSKAMFQSFALSNGGAAIHLSDVQVAGLAEIFRRKAMMNQGRIHVISREGLDFIRQEDGSYHRVYVSKEEFLCNPERGEPKKYVFKALGKDSNPIGSDILNAPRLQGSEEERKFLENLLQVNKKDCVGKMIGWFAASFASQAIRSVKQEYPSLHVFGTAGAGKSKTVELFAGISYHLKRPDILMAALLTPYSVKTRVSASASVPVIWDECKLHEMKADTRNLITQYIRNNYTGAEAESGTIRRESGQSYVDLRKYVNQSPLVFISETMETESAIVDRYVSVPLTKQDRAGKQNAFSYVFNRREMMGSFGKELIAEVMDLSVEEVRMETEDVLQPIVTEWFGDKHAGENRRIWNYVVTLYGLKLFQKVVQGKFGNQFDEIFSDMVEAIGSSVQNDLPNNMSESSKVLNMMAYLTKAEVPDETRLIYGVDYTVGAGHVDIKLHGAYFKYMKHMRAHGLPPLFIEYDKFAVAMKKHPANVDATCMDNFTLKDTPRTDVHRFSIKVFDKEGIDEFRSK